MQASRTEVSPLLHPERSDGAHVIDDYLFKKRKNKLIQAAGYNFCHDAKKARKSQCVVSSSCIVACRGSSS